MKIYIIGMVGSGKTTLAKTLSKELDIPYYELDSIVYHGKVKNKEEEILLNFNKIIKEENWIIEDVLRPYFMKALSLANYIIFLDVNLITRDYRIIKRYIIRKFYNEDKYSNTLKEVKQLLKWSHEFKKNKDERLKLLDGYEDKVLTIHNNKEIKLLIKELSHMK